MGIKVLLLVAVILGLASIFADAAVGLAVYYNPPYSPSACYQWNNGPWVAGVSNTLWQGKAASCGKYYRVTCIGAANAAPYPCKRRSVVVKVVDYCANPCNGDVNLSRDAFNQIADLNAGKIRVRYDPL